MKHLLTSAAVAAMLVATPALAGNQDKMKSQGYSQTGSAVSFVSSQSSSDWLSDNLIGATVKNRQDETLGDINNIIVSENGNVKAVIIGVGGFLGIGEKDVGIEFSALEIKTGHKAPMASNEKTQERVVTTTNKAGDRASAEQDRQMNKPATADRMPTDKNQQTDSRAPARDSAEDRHDDFVIVVDATKKQLEEAPAFKYLGESEKRADATDARDNQKKTN